VLVAAASRADFFPLELHAPSATTTTNPAAAGRVNVTGLI
jgi:hypothetical protein